MFVTPYLPYPFVRVDPVRSLLALEGESERFRGPAEVRESEAAGIAPGQLKELGRPHDDIVGDII